MRILVSGDSHADVNHVKSMVARAEKHECEKIFVVGDYGFWPRHKGGLKFLDAVAKIDFPVYFLPGNHEDWDMLEKHEEYADRFKTKTEEGFIEVHTNSFYAPTGHTWEWDGIKFLSVGGAYSIDRRRRVKFIDWFPQEIITEEDVAKCSGVGKIDVLLSHDVPSCVDINLPFINHYGQPVDLDNDTTLNRNRLQVIVDMVDPSLCVHGHWHMQYHTHCGELEVIGLDCNQTGQYFTVIDTEFINV